MQREDKSVKIQALLQFRIKMLLKDHPCLGKEQKASHQRSARSNPDTANDRSQATKKANKK